MSSYTEVLGLLHPILSTLPFSLVPPGVMFNTVIASATSGTGMGDSSGPLNRVTIEIMLTIICDGSQGLDLDKVVNVAAKDGDGWTALQRAAWHRHEAVVRLIVERGADIAAKDGNGWTALGKAMDGSAKANQESAGGGNSGVIGESE